jgi:hypothetical protein
MSRKGPSSNSRRSAVILFTLRQYHIYEFITGDFFKSVNNEYAYILLHNSQINYAVEIIVDPIIAEKHCVHVATKISRQKF